MFVIAKGAPTKYETTQDAMNSAPEIDVSININIPKSQTLKEEKKYKCTCCGDSWDVQKNRFSKSKSVLYQSNNGYINICNSCRDSYYYQLIDLYSGSEEKAIEHMCRQFGWIYHIDALEASRQISEDRSRISNYLPKKNLGQTAKVGTTDIDTVKFDYLNRSNRTIETIEDIEDYSEYKLTPKMIKFWGVNYEAQIYQTLQGYYDELLKLCETKPDIKKQKMMKNLCLLEYQMQSNIQAGKDIATLSNSYKAMFEASGLKNEEVDTNKDSYGTWISMIEKYTPADYYKDKTKYKDFFGIGEYIERFMFRPLKNLLTGSKEKEKEFWINDDKGGD